MVTPAAIRKSIEEKKDPVAFWLQRLAQLEADFKEKAAAILEQAKKDLDEASKQSVFKDLGPAKDLAKKTAEDVVEAFKQETDGKISAVIDNIEVEAKEALDEAKQELFDATEQLREQIVEFITEADEHLGTLISESVAAINEHIEHSETIVKTLKGDKGDRGDDGDDGNPGAPGAKGDKGDPGSPDSGQQIVSKLAELPFDDKLPISAVKGLAEELANIRRIAAQKNSQQGGGGGGMSNVQHETKSTSSATTTVSTNYRVAGNGTVLWVFYQGQLLVRGTHYTVGSDFKTLTLTFTPSDSTSIDIIYARA